LSLYQPSGIDSKAKVKLFKNTYGLYRYVYKNILTYKDEVYHIKMVYWYMHIYNCMDVYIYVWVSAHTCIYALFVMDVYKEKIGNINNS
jgi:hypothetical protein